MKTIDVKGMSPFKNHDILILCCELAAGVKKKELFSCLLSTRGFLLADSEDDISESFPDGTCYFNHRMSSEEIIFKVNSVVFEKNERE